MRACLAMAARRHEECVSAGAGRWRCSGLRVWQAVTCVCGVCGEDEGVAEALGMQSTTHDESVLSLRWRYTAGESRQGYTPADGMSIAPTRHTDSAGASSMIESDSISVVSDGARGDKASARGGSC